ncbi:MAG: eL32 family ribosomal protein [Candidatus Aenigmatarchaeota archaeon]
MRRFIRQDYSTLKRLKRKWRRPKGRHSKLRVGKCGSGITPSIGYKKNRESVAIINNLKDLDNIKSGILASSVGKKKRMLIAEKAEKLGVKITNLNLKKMKKEIEREKKEREKKKEDTGKDKSKGVDKKEVEKNEKNK